MNNSLDNNNNNNNEYNTKLYNSVFNNIYLRCIIFSHLKIYNILHGIVFKSNEQWEEFKYKEYLNNITLEYDEECEDLSQLPENIKHIQIDRTYKYIVINNLKSLPNHVESIKFTSSFNSYDIKSEFSTINSTVLSKVIYFSIVLMGNEDQIELNKILPSVTDLIIESKKAIELKKEMLPSNLKRIWLNNVQSLENGCLLESLLYAHLLDCSTSIINQIPSNNLIKLDFKCRNSYSSNVKIDNSIIFPESLQELSIECHSFNAKLPNNLKTLKLITSILEDTIIFPPSLEIINISIEEPSNKEVFDNKDSVPCNLKSLELPCSSIVDNNGQPILPDKLKKVIFKSKFGFDQVLQVNQLPSSLTYLNFGNLYNQVINTGVLPSSLKTLIFGFKYTQIINPLAIPQELESLEILNRGYSHPINLPASTHPNTLIKCNDLNLYYNPSNISIRKLRLSNDFNLPLSTLQLQDKSSLEYLHLGYRFEKLIQLSDLPINNNIKTLELSGFFRQPINLEHFQNLETIIALQTFSNISITTTKTITNQQEIIYNNYSLKNIIFPQFKSHFLINLDKNFYQFIKFVKD